MSLELLLLPMVFIPIILGVLPLLVKNVKRINLVMLIVGIMELMLCAYFMFAASDFAEGVVALNWFSGFGISFKINGLGILQAVAASIIWVGATMSSQEYFKEGTMDLRRYYSFLSITFGATLGIFLANDLFTLFIFFEVMSFASYVLVAHEQNEESVKASNSYLAVAVIGGLSMLSGIFMLNSIIGTSVIDELLEASSLQADNTMLVVAAFMIFVGFAAKAGAFPINGWLPKAYTAAPAPVSATLSGILSKCGVYGIIIVTFRILQGNAQWAGFILAIGVLTMVIGGFFALLSANLKETLAYSSMSQIGFMIVGIGMTQLLGEHGTIAAYGTALHMINHTLIKLVLFTCAGIIYKNTHSLDLNKLQGYGAKKPLLAIVFGTASLGIMGVPFFNGYVSKTLLHEAIVEKIAEAASTAAAPSTMFRVVEMLFLFSGGLTVAYMTKLFICLFIKKPAEGATSAGKGYVTMQTGVLLSMVSAVMLLFGVLPNRTLDKIAETTVGFMGFHPLTQAVNYFSLTNLKGAAISIAIGLLLYFVIVPLTIMTKEKGYINPWDKRLSVENLVWRPLIFGFLPFVFGILGRVIDKSSELFLLVAKKLFLRTEKIPKSFFNSKKQAEDENVQSPAISITRSLSYSLLLFGIGFAITMLYLLFSTF